MPMSLIIYVIGGPHLEKISETNDVVSHYQELSVSKGDNHYQTLTRK